MNKNHLPAVATAILIAFSGASVGAAEAAPIGPSSPLSPVSQQNAVRKAQQYLEMTAYSRQGLITQLVEGEQFSTADSTYAVDSLNADWNQQAAKKARQYLEMTAYSHAGLLSQLIEGEYFTPSQAAYGVNAVGL